ncbi:flagellar hook protein FlgE [Pseudomonas sp. NFACC15-1]|uniref:flagellar basal-body rod protein FlgF n=1 Tax=unclassified Pseudomonas TaxID=196821 RepID=UPI00087FDEF0|nr:MULTISPECIES: flagellar basal-body rod protein FlgF [unclassified Pseudomonas]SDA89612.1 flagellar hook protein FlgE [Pseudomonas sp. NFACC15-1]SDW12549.1 flagellar hook protein FlgE [Pseudomonas sp. NFACC14]
MLQAFFNGMSGLFSFAKGLDNVSNNVSNMNTPGYRGSDTFYRAVNGQDGQSFGSGIAGTQVRIKPGENRQTGNNTNVAINGAGYFVLRDEPGALSYTRAGQFEVDKDGYLVDTISQQRIAGIDSSGNLRDINIQGQRTLPPQATTRVEMVGALARTGTTEATHQINAIQVFDSTGASHTLSVKFEPKTTPANSWSVTVSDASGVQLQTGTIAFGIDGSPATGFNTLSVPLTVNGKVQNIVLDFGTPGSFNLASQVASGPSHTLGARVVDGSAVAGLNSFAFDEKGILKFTYANGEKRDGSQLALADFADESALIAGANSLYHAPSSMTAEFGRAGEKQFGRIQGGYLELSNVDLAQEFGDILIIQRGYQASSRVMTVSNEMLEQLYNGTRGG